jgi:nitroimidazol reductase NimA-like FMN-containing flavoprotein (pyridoxamine 5'-phosphate oxidase superfamily)
MRIPAELPYDTCLSLLRQGSVGRAAVCTPDGPRIVPVNYAVVDDDTVVFRTAPWSVLGTHAWNERLAFEVDEVDPEHQTGWSVVASGRGSLIEDPEEMSRIRAFHDPVPWAGGQRWMLVALRWQDLTGRRIGPPTATMAG